jgi:hypothetical protein
VQSPYGGTPSISPRPGTPSYFTDMGSLVVSKRHASAVSWAIQQPSPRMQHLGGGETDYASRLPPAEPGADGSVRSLPLDRPSYGPYSASTQIPFSTPPITPRPLQMDDEWTTSTPRALSATPRYQGPPAAHGEEHKGDCGVEVGAWSGRHRRSATETNPLTVATYLACV